LATNSGFSQEDIDNEKTVLVPLVREHPVNVGPAKYLLRIEAAFSENRIKVEKVYSDSPLKQMKRPNRLQSFYEIENDDEIIAIKDGFGRFVAPQNINSYADIVNSLKVPATQILVRDKDESGSWIYDVSLLKNDKFQETPNKNQERSNNQPKIVVFLLGDTTDSQVGASVKKAMDSFNALFEEQSQSKYLRNPVEMVTAQEFTKASILQKINSAIVYPDDTIFCFINCHGAFDPNRSDDANGHFFNMPDGRGDLRRTEIRNALLQKNARFCCLISESCNAEGIISDNDSAPATQGVPVNPFFDSLFFGQTGFVDINSSSKDEYSFTNVFSPIVTTTLSSNTAKTSKTNWTRYVMDLTAETQIRFTRMRSEALGQPDLEEATRRLLEKQRTQTVKVYSKPN